MASARRPDSLGLAKVSVGVVVATESRRRESKMGMGCFLRMRRMGLGVVLCTLLPVAAFAESQPREQLLDVGRNAVSPLGAMEAKAAIPAAKSMCHLISLHVAEMQTHVMVKPAPAPPGASPEQKEKAAIALAEWKARADQLLNYASRAQSKAKYPLSDIERSLKEVQTKDLAIALESARKQLLTALEKLSIGRAALATAVNPPISTGVKKVAPGPSPDNPGPSPDKPPDDDSPPLPRTE